MRAIGLLNQKVDGVFRYNYGFKPDVVQHRNRKQEAQPHHVYGAATLLEVQIQAGLRDVPGQAVSTRLSHYVIPNAAQSRQSTSLTRSIIIILELALFTLPPFALVSFYFVLFR